MHFASSRLALRVGALTAKGCFEKIGAAKLRTAAASYVSGAALLLGAIGVGKTLTAMLMARKGATAFERRRLEGDRPWEKCSRDNRLALPADYSGDPWDDLYQDLNNTRGSNLIRAGAPKADQYLGMATMRGHHGAAVVTGTQISEADYSAELASVIADAALLPAAIAASANADAGIDVGLAADIASDLVSTRAAYLATLQARFPSRGFV